MFFIEKSTMLNIYQTGDLYKVLNGHTDWEKIFFILKNFKKNKADLFNKLTFYYSYNGAINEITIIETHVKKLC